MDEMIDIEVRKGEGETREGSKGAQRNYFLSSNLVYLH